MEDFRGVAKSRDTLALAAKALLRRRMADLRDARPAHKAVSIKQKGLANVYDAKALDWMLRMTTNMGGLVAFQARNPARLLEAGEERFFRNVDELPEPIRRASPGRVVRSCIRDTSTGGDQTRGVLGSASAQSSLVPRHGLCDLAKQIRNLRQWSWQGLRRFRARHSPQAPYQLKR